MSKTITLEFKNCLVYLNDLTLVSQDIIKKQETTSLSSFILAKAVSLFAPLPRILTKNGRTTTLIRSEGNIKNLIVDSNEKNHVKALISNPEIIWEGDLNEAITFFGFRNAFLRIKVMQDKMVPYESEVSMQSETLVDDLAYFFNQSQQIRSAVLSCTKFKDNEDLEESSSAIFTALPSVTDSDIDWIYDFIEKNPFHEKGLKFYKEYLLEQGAKLIDETPWISQCDCSSEKYLAAIKLLSKQEIESLLEEKGNIEAQCHYCHKKYYFTKEDLTNTCELQ
ncbi:Hsp33 family molecular chaperone HslO [Mycoplasma sp. 128]